MGLFNRSKAPETGEVQSAAAPAEPTRPPTSGTDPAGRGQPAAAASSALPSSPSVSSPPASAPAEPPTGPSPAEVATQSLLKDLAQKIGLLAGTAEAERDAVKKFTNRVEKMEDRLEMFQILFESLSLKYNPFLGSKESNAFEGQTLLPDREYVAVNGGAPSPVPLAPGAEAIAASVDGQLASGHAGPDGAAAPLAGNGTELLSVAGPAPPGAQPAAAPAVSFAPIRQVPRHLYPWGHHPVAGSRESYLALCWFEHVYKRVDAATVLQLLDHYRELGWLAPEAHEWLRTLAVATAPLSPPSDGKRVQELYYSPKRLSPLEMVRLHKSSLRFFDHVFRFSLDRQEARHLERAVGGLVERG
jgi:flagellar protein